MEIIAGFTDDARTVISKLNISTTFRQNNMILHDDLFIR